MSESIDRDSYIDELNKVIEKLRQELRHAEDTRNLAQKASTRDCERRRDVEERLHEYVKRYKRIQEALEHARNKHPNPQYRIPALLEEAGEFAQAILDHGQHSEQARKEGYQVIATVIRTMEEVDPSLPQ